MNQNRGDLREALLLEAVEQQSEGEENLEKKGPGTTSTIFLYIVSAIILLVIIISIIAVVIIILTNPTCPDCDDCPTINCNIGGTPYFNTKWPYYSDGTNCKKFDNIANALEVEYQNSSTINVFISPVMISTDSSCPNLTVAPTDNYYTSNGIGWYMPPDKILKFSSRIFIEDDKFLSFFNGQFITTNTGLVPITFGTNPPATTVQLLVDNPSTQKLGITVTGIDSSAKIQINVLSK